MIDAISYLLKHYNKGYFILDSNCNPFVFSKDVEFKRWGLKIFNDIQLSFEAKNFLEYLPKNNLDPVPINLPNIVKDKGSFPFYCIRFEDDNNNELYMFLATFKHGPSVKSIPDIHLLLNILCELLGFISNKNYLGYFISTNNLRIEFIEESLSEFLGYTQKELKGQHIKKILPVQPKEFFSQNSIKYEAFLQKGVTMKVNREGEAFLLQKLVVPISGNVDKTITRYINLYCKPYEKNSQTGLPNKIFNELPDPALSECSLTTDANGKINWASESFLSLSGHNLDDIIGNDIYMFTGPQTDTSAIQKMLTHFANGGESYELELINYKRCGKSYLCIQKIEKIKDKIGNPIGYLWNISEKSREEIDRKRFEQLKRLCDLSKECMVITNDDGKIEWANPEFLNKTEYSLEELLGKSPGSILQGPNTNPVDVEAFRRKLSKGEDFKQTITNYSKSGNEYKAVILISVIKDIYGKVVNYIGIQHFVENDRNNFKDGGDSAMLTVMQQLSSQYEELCKRQEEIEIQNNALSESYSLLSSLNYKVKSSINYAKKLQSSIMPNQYFIENKFGESFIFYKPKDVVSGDFYWYNETDEWLRLIIGDCTGHGVSGAFMTIMATGLLDRFITDTRLEHIPDAFNQLNNALKEKLINNIEVQDSTLDGFEFGMLQIDKRTGQYHYLGSKMNLVKISKEGIVTIKAHRFPIGGNSKFYKGKLFEKIHSFTPTKGECVYLFSDGYPDQFNNENNQKVTTKRFKELLLRYHKLSMDDQRLKLQEMFRNWKGKQPQTDDIIVFGYRPDKFKISEESKTVRNEKFHKSI